MANKKLSNALKKQDKKKENRPEVLSGELGIPINGNKIVEVPNRKGYVFVRIHGNMSELIQAYNASVSPIYDLPVLITRQKSVYKIIGRDFDRYQDNWGAAPYLPRHGTQHSFNPELGMGADTTWIYGRQFMPLLGYPSGTNAYGSMYLSIVPDFYEYNGHWQYAQTTGTPSFVPYLPTITGSAVMTLLYIQPSDNSLRIIAGTPFSNSITGSAQLAQYIPDIDRNNAIPISAVRLVTGTTGITWDNIYDVRDFYTVGRGGFGGIEVQDEGVSIGTGTIFNFVGPNVSASISGSVVRIFITGSAGGSVTVPVTGTFIVQDEGATLGSVTTLNAVGGILDMSISGSVARLNAFISTGSIGRSQLNVDTVGQAVVRKIIAGVGIGITSTGVDSGTGDVTVFVTGSNAIQDIGWIQDTPTWTRTGNHTFTVDGTRLLEFRQGTKVRFKQGGSYKYGVVGDASGAGTTTVELILNTDFTMVSGTVTDTWFSYIENPYLWPDWFSWSPTFTGFSSPPTTLVHRWRARNREILLMWKHGADGTSNDAVFTISLPVAAESIANATWGASHSYRDAGVGAANLGLAVINSAQSIVTLFTATATGVWTNTLGKRSTSGFIIYEF